jgi:acetyltransferase-like isoleucine patch superfamily enzyme
MRDESGRVSLESGVRQYARPTWRHWLRHKRFARLLGSIGEHVYIERDVEFLRHPERVSLGSHVIVKEGARICPTNPAAAVAIGDWTTIGYHTFIFASTSIAIGADCLVAPFCYFVDSNHGLRREARIREQPMTASPIVIEDDVWLGVRVTVLRGVRIGRGAVIEAGTVVSEDVPPYAIVTGRRATVTGYRE